MADNPTAGPDASRQPVPTTEPADPAAAKLLRDLLDDNVEGFRLSAARNKRRALTFKISAASIGALTTLLLGLKSNPVFAECEPQLSALALLLSALIPVMVAWDTFFDHRWLWVRFTAAHTVLFKIRDDLKYAEVNRSLSQKKLDGFYERFRDAVDQTSDAWLEKRERPPTGEQIGR